MNRFFYSCPACLFRFAIDQEGRSSPRSIAGCPVCAGELRLLGATQGVLSWKTPCDDRCTHAIGRKCTCSCGGKNHGSKIVVPFISGVVDFSRYPSASLSETAAQWERFKLGCESLIAALPDELRAARAAYQQHERVPYGLWNDVVNFNRALRWAEGAADYRLRFSRLRELRAKWAAPAAASFTLPAAAVVPFSSTQLLFAL